MNYELILQSLITGLVMGSIYALASMGITFIYSIMKMINWATGEFFMIGSYLQYFVIVLLLGEKYWYIGIPISGMITFLIGILVYEGLIKPAFVGGIERSDEYITIVTICLGMVILRNLAALIVGPYHLSPPDYMPPISLGIMTISGNRIVASIGSVIILGLFYFLIKKTWIGRAFRAVAQNRIGSLISGIKILNIDRVAFGLGVSLSALSGALLVTEFTAHPSNGVLAVVKGFEIIVIGGLGSILGAVIASFFLAIAESLLSVLISPAYRDVYGFLALIIILLFRPRGLMGESERIA